MHDGSISFGDNQATSRMYLSDGNDTDTEDESDRLRSNSYESSYDKQKWRATEERQPSWQDQQTRPKVQKLAQPEQRRPLLRGMSTGLLRKAARRGSRRSLRQLKASSKPVATSKRGVSRPRLDRKDSFGSIGGSITENQTVVVPYLDKLCSVCEQVGYPYEYADLVGSQFLGLDSADPVTHVNGHVPLIAELVEFVAQAFMRITDFADLILLFVDDFQWVDAFTWKVIRALGQSGKKMLLICAMRSHDKQALRRMSTAVNCRLEITLGPLDLPEIKELMCSVLKCAESAIDESLCTELYQRTGGVPVYVIELLEALKRSNTLSQNGEGKFTLADDEHLVDVSLRDTCLSVAPNPKCS